VIAHLVTLRNPFDPLGGRSLRVIRRPRRLRALAPRTPLPVIALLNGRPLPRAAWRRRLRDGDHAAFVVLPLGAGGRGGSDPTRTLLSLVLVAASGWAAGLLFPGGGLAAAAARAGLLLGGQALLNAVLPAPGPEDTGRGREVFSLSPQGNRSRLEEPVPVQYGRMRFAPDFAAAPWAEAAGNEQYLYCLYSVGAGHFEIEKIEIGDTPVEAFGEVETEIVPPGGTVTLFPTAVVTSDAISGQELRSRVTVTWTRSGTTLTVTETGHRRTSGQTVRITATGQPVQTVQIGTVPNEDSWTATVSGWTATSGSAEILSIVGGLTGVPVCGPGQTAARVGVDLAWPGGLYGQTNTGRLLVRSTTVRVEAAPIDDAGTLTGGWVLLGEPTRSDKTRTPQRESHVWTLPTPGRWAVRAWRTNPRDSDANAGHDVIWTGLRGYLAEAQNWPQVTLLAMRFRATGNLSRLASRQVHVTATRKLPVWNGTVWSAPVPTRSIAWALADMARSTLYGPGLPDARIDLAGLLALDTLWAARGDTCDMRITTAGAWWDAAARVALTGRARPCMQGGILRIVRDGPQTIPVAMFSQRNIRDGTFSIDWTMPGPETADAVEVSYLDAATWQPQRVTARLPGSTAARPARIVLDGVTSRAQALREGLYHAACNRYRRRTVRFETEMEGFIPALGDLVAIQHDLVGWGAQAEAVAWNAATLTLTVSEPMNWSGSGHVVGLRRRDGSVAGPIAVTRGADDRTLRLVAAPGFTPDTGQDRERTHVAFGLAQSWSARARIVSVRPVDASRVAVEAVVEDPSVHTAETGRVAPPLRQGRLPALPDAPEVTGLRVVLSPDAIAFLSWRPAPGAIGYEVEVAEQGARESPDEGWTRVADTAAAELMIRPPYGPKTRFRVRALARGAGPWAEVAFGVARPIVWLTRVDDAFPVIWGRRATDTAWANLTDTLWTSFTEDYA
jgi:hypothetical protein